MREGRIIQKKRKIQITLITRETLRSKIFVPIFPHTIPLTTPPNDKQRRGRNSIFRTVKHALLSKYPTICIYIYISSCPIFTEEIPIRRSSGRRITDKAVESRQSLYRGYNIRGDGKGKEHTERTEFNHISIWRTFLPFLFTTPASHQASFLSTDKVVQSPSSTGCGPLHDTP